MTNPTYKGNARGSIRFVDIVEYESDKNNSKVPPAKRKAKRRAQRKAKKG